MDLHEAVPLSCFLRHLQVARGIRSLKVAGFPSRASGLGCSGS